jgi:hypothetical protein
LKPSSLISTLDLSLQRRHSANEEKASWLFAMIATAVAFEKPAVAAGFAR